jgi:cytochrome c-type biogenesis protein CcmH
VGVSLFISLGVVLTLMAAGIVVAPLLSASTVGKRAPWAAVIIALMFPPTVLLLYLNITNYDWLATGAAANTTDAGSLNVAVAELEKRLQQNPEDLDGWLLLGRSLVQLQQYDSARDAFVRALELSGGSNSDAKLGVAEALLLTERNEVVREAAPLLDEVLSVQPQNAKALWYGGLVALAQDDLPAVEDRWRRLLALSPPESVRQIVEQQLTALGIPSDTQPASAGLDVTISITDSLAGRVEDGAPLFLVARDDAVGGPPVAVVRQTIEHFPVTLNISDANVMIPGRSLGNLERVRLIARVANGGDPVAKPGDIYGESLWTGDMEGEPVHIVMDQLVKP